MYPAHRSASPFLRRSALWAALSLALAGTGAQALTLGSPQVQSKLGEPLRAEIGITQISAEEEQGLQAELADADLYRSLHMELPATTGGRTLDVHVQLIKRENGNLVLRLSSQQAVTRRDMDLLVRMRWSTGQLLRNVTLSMDDGSAGRAIVSPMAPSAPPPTAASPAAVAAASSLPVAKPRAAAPSKPAAAESSDGKAAPKGKVEVQRGDTASEIVAKQMPGGVSLDQMLVALLRHNPDAFVDNNVNRLKAGALLTLPSAQEAKELSREDAREEVLFQTQNFFAYRAELAARAGRGEIAKAERSSAGKLQAQVQNKASKTNQDKLTLSKPKDDKGEDQIAKQREAKEVAERAAELSRNVSELGKLANEAANAGGGEGVNLPSPPQTAQSDWMEDLLQNPLAPVGAGVLVALMVVLALLRRHQRRQEDDIQGLPPLNVKFDLDLPDHPSKADASELDDGSHGHGTHPAQDSHADTAPHAARPNFEMPDISLDLSPSSHHPLQVRMDLAEELWKLGQLHTSRALMEEVAQEASGELQAKALQWLAERS